MPKLKTRKGVAKRFKVSKKGKITAKKAGKGHLLTSKTRKRKRALSSKLVIEGHRAITVQTMLPYR